MEYDDFNNEELPSAQSYRLQKIYEIEDELTQEREKRTALCTKYRRSIRIISVIDNTLIVTVMGLSSSGLGVLTTLIAAPAIGSSNYCNCCSCHRELLCELRWKLRWELRWKLRSKLRWKLRFKNIHLLYIKLNVFSKDYQSIKEILSLKNF